jgi:predicted DNA-binding transcriptional regulator AlpA
MARPKPTLSDSIATLDDLALMRLPAVLRVVPISKKSWWEGVAAGRYPSPIRVSKRVSAWRVRDIRQLLASFETTSIVRVMSIVVEWFARTSL